MRTLISVVFLFLCLPIVWLQEHRSKVAPTAAPHEVRLVKVIKNAGSCAFSPDGRTLAIRRENRVELLDTATWQVTRSLPCAGYRDEEFRPAFSPDGSLLAIVSRTAVRLTDFLPHPEHRKPAEYLKAWSEVMDASTVVDLWSTQTWQRVRRLTSHPEIAGPVLFSPDGQWLATGQRDDLYFEKELKKGATVLLWHTSTWTLHRSLVAPQLPDYPRRYARIVDILRFSPDSRLLVTAGIDGWDIPPAEAVVWSVDDGRLVHNFGEGHFPEPSFAADGRQMLPGDGSPWVDTTTCHRVPAMPALPGEVAFSPDRQTMTLIRDGRGVLLDAHTSRPIGQLGKVLWCDAVQFSPDSHLLATLSWGCDLG